MIYNPKEIEKKWQDFWFKNNTFFTNLYDEKKPKKYILAMFPYPSGEGLHIGHVRNYTISDVMARFFRLKGFNVLFPIGWDSFGLPAEQYAIQTNNHPASFTKKNIDKFRIQLKKMGFSYDWSKEVDTSDPKYYKWTQWIFSQMFKDGLAEYCFYPVYWCPKLGTVLANEEIKVVNEIKVSDRGNYPVEKKNIKQWILKITNYSYELLDGLRNLDWPENIKTITRNWIGLSEGTIIYFDVLNSNIRIPVFTTRPDTIFGVVSIVLSLTNELLNDIIPFELKEKVESFRDFWKRHKENKKEKIEPEGIFIDVFVCNPIKFGLTQIPVFVGNFIVEGYGTDAVMLSPFFKDATSYNDEFSLKEEEILFSKKERENNKNIDFFFSQKYQISNMGVFLKKRINDVETRWCYKYYYFFLEDADFVNSKYFAIQIVRNYLKREKKGHRAEFFHLKDWVFSRQRYWGEPIPVLHKRDNETESMLDIALPLVLPALSDFVPDPKFFSPLEKLIEWTKIEKNNQEWKRDTNVMPQWAGSCWYYLSFLLTRQNDFLEIYSDEAKQLINKWAPVDIYIGGSEHATLHLLYSRFWHKFLKKKTVVGCPEPFLKLICQGMVLGSDGEKMSKSRGNVINPDFFLEEYGSDSLRLYVLFLGPVDKNSSFDPIGVKAMNKWLSRVYMLYLQKEKIVNDLIENELEKYYLQMIVAVENYYNQFKFNLVISSLMIFINHCYKSSVIPVSYLLHFCQLLNPLSPHISEELWSFFKKESINNTELVNNSKNLNFKFNLSDSKKTIIQLNGKKKLIIFVESEVFENDKLEKVIKKIPELKSLLLGKKVKKIIIKPKLINFVVE